MSEHYKEMVNLREENAQLRDDLRRLSDQGKKLLATSLEGQGFVVALNDQNKILRDEWKQSLSLLGRAREALEAGQRFAHEVTTQMYGILPGEYDAFVERADSIITAIDDSNLLKRAK